MATYVPVTVVPSGGAPFVQVSGNAPPMTVVPNAAPITLVQANAPGVVLYNPDGSPYTGVIISPKGFVAEGDSLSAGQGSILVNYPTRLSAITGLTVVNRGFGGDRITAMDTNYATDVAPYYNALTADVLLLQGATNDLFNSVPVLTIQAAFTSLVAKALATGFRVVLATIMPSTAIFGANETARIAINTWLRANYAALGAYALADWAAIPEAADPLNTAFYLDGTHPTNALIGLMADAFQAASGAARVAADTTPNAFSFTDVTGVPVSTVTTSAAVTISGINASTPISVTGGEYSINGAAFTASAGTLKYGDQVRARATSSASNSTAVNVVVTVGGVSDTFTITTAAAAVILPFNTTPPLGTGTFSNSNQTVQSTAASTTVIGATAISGKKVFAFTIDVTPTNFMGQGIATANTTTPGIGQDANRSVSWYAGINSIWINNASLYAVPALANGDTAGFYVDETAGLMWVTKDGVNFYGNAGTALTLAQVNAGTNGINIAPIKANGAIYPAVGNISSAGKRWTRVEYPSGWGLPTGATQMA